MFSHQRPTIGLCPYRAPRRQRSRKRRMRVLRPLRAAERVTGPRQGLIAGEREEVCKPHQPHIQPHKLAPKKALEMHVEQGLGCRETMVPSSRTKCLPEPISSPQPACHNFG